MTSGGSADAPEVQAAAEASPSPSRQVPQRIVSLVPSHTESLHALGVAGRVVGRTRFCIHPQPWVGTVPAVGGTKDAKLDRILALRPDLVVADKDENPKALVDGLEAAGVDVLWSDIGTPEEAARFLVRLGERCGAGAAGAAWADRIHHERSRGGAVGGEVADAATTRAQQEAGPVPVFCPIWHGPWMTFDRTAYPDAMLRAAGLRNVFADHAGPKYFAVEADEVASSGAAYCLLPTEPFPFHRRAIDTAPLGHCGQADRVRIVDGEALTWFGVRTVEGLRTLRAAAEGLRQGTDGRGHVAHRTS